MRLINTTTLTLEYFIGDNVPPYAILSHTWGEEEVMFQDISDTKKILKWKGYTKIRDACDLARRDEWEYIWIDTCCINKESSAELSESINSMYNWYRNAQICYAYLNDVPRNDIDPNSPQSAFYQSRWFTRGWTLQELLAPSDVIFYDKEWNEIGTKFRLQGTISGVTGIEPDIIVDNRYLMDVAVAQRMSWAAKRQTTRGEDMAYCLMGLFGVNMPLLYGEGPEKAFIRFQEEIMKTSDDHSIFAWTTDDEPEQGWGLLARSPAAFATSGNITMMELHNRAPRPPYHMTNRGLKINLPLRPLQDGDPFPRNHNYPDDLFLVALNCRRYSNLEAVLAILLVKFDDDSYCRTDVWKIGEVEPGFLHRERTTVFVLQNHVDLRMSFTFSKLEHLRLQGPISINTNIQVANSGFILREVYKEDVGFQPEVGFGSTFFLSEEEEHLAIVFRHQSTEEEFAVVFGRHPIGKALFCWIFTTRGCESVKHLVEQKLQTGSLAYNNTSRRMLCERASGALDGEYSVFVSIRKKGSLDRGLHTYYAIIEIRCN
jgi:Heterokaryon incompatibility protein (HET)